MLDAYIPHIRPGPGEVMDPEMRPRHGSAGSKAPIFTKISKHEDPGDHRGSCIFDEALQGADQ
jgi:hypothetical protein